MSDIDPPWRLDPWKNLIGVGWHTTGHAHPFKDTFSFFDRVGWKGDGVGNSYPSPPSNGVTTTITADHGGTIVGNFAGWPEFANSLPGATGITFWQLSSGPTISGLSISFSLSDPDGIQPPQGPFSVDYSSVTFSNVGASLIWSVASISIASLSSDHFFVVMHFA